MNTPAIAVFGYRRPQALRACLASLLACDGVEEMDLSVFVDGAAVESERNLVAETARVVSKIEGFRSLEVHCSDIHQGLSTSIIKGISHVLMTHPAVIVLEDDLAVQPGFLRFILDGLEHFWGDERVFSVCGYSNRVRVPQDYPFDSYFCPRSSSWGWATWKDRWESVDWNPTIGEWQMHRRAFAAWGGSDCPDLLRASIEGRTASWAIRFCFSEYLQGKLSLFPVKSLVNPSAGFDGFGTNCLRYSRFRFDLDGRTGPFRFPKAVEVVPVIRKSALRYHSIPIRVWSRLRNLFA